MSYDQIELKLKKPEFKLEYSGHIDKCEFRMLLILKKIFFLLNVGLKAFLPKLLNICHKTYITKVMLLQEPYLWNFLIFEGFSFSIIGLKA